jgi:glycosyltransferase involved in cell wall biosynthesis
MIYKDGKKIRIGVLTSPISASGIIPLSNLLNILSEQSHTLYLITGNEGYTFFKNNEHVITFGIDHVSEKNAVKRVLTYCFLQIRISLILLKMINKCDIWIFFLGGEVMVFPLFTAKLFRKKVFLLFGASQVKIYSHDNLSVIWMKLLTAIDCLLSDKIILYSKNMMKEWKLGRWENKIEFAHEHIIDFQQFSIMKHYDERDNLVGFIGRLNTEKGIWNLILAINLVLAERKDIKFLIIGDGSLRKEIEQYIDQKNLQSYVNFKGWISHDNLPNYLNQLQLIVIPSYTEGLPNVMLEALSCGTPVLATPVGAIPDILHDGETGFIMRDNTPECIAQNIIRAMSAEDREKITENGRALVRENFTFERTVKRWKKLINTL